MTSSGEMAEAAVGGVGAFHDGAMGEHDALAGAGGAGGKADERGLDVAAAPVVVGAGGAREPPEGVVEAAGGRIVGRSLHTGVKEGAVDVNAPDRVLDLGINEGIGDGYDRGAGVEDGQRTDDIVNAIAAAQGDALSGPTPRALSNAPRSATRASKSS